MRIRKRRVDGVVQDYHIGNCYQRAGTLITRFKDGFLCHGLVFHPKTGWHGHAWVEVGDTVIDTKAFPVTVYYAIGKVRDVKRYNYMQAINHMLSTKHWGPWDK